MELSPGHKLTEIGVIPVDWDVVRLAECATFRTGPFGSALHKSDYTTDGVPVINPMHLIDGRVVPSRTMTITEQAAQSLSDVRLRRGNIVIGRRGDMGRCAVVGEHQEGWLCGTGSMIVRSKNADPRFLQLVISNPRAVAELEESSVGTTMVNLNQSTLARLRIQWPPLSEQKAIADAVNDVTDLLERLSALIAKKRDLKQAAMQQLITGRRRLPGFDGKWQATQLNCVAEIKTGPFGSSLHQRDYADVGTPIITVEHLGQFGIEHVGLPLVSDADRQRLSAYELAEGDIVFSRVGSIDRNALVRAPEAGWLFSGRLLRVRPDKRILHAPFLSRQFKSEAFRTAIRAVAVGQTMASLNTRILGGMAVSIPSLPEQAAIAKGFEDIDAELAALEARLEKTKALKQAMMQELLTGRLRLVAHELAHA